jgi:predicted ATPase
MAVNAAPLYLTGVRRNAREERTAFPWSLPIVANMRELRFTAPVTFFVGENGSGKSTLLEGLAVASGAVAVGGASLENDPTLGAARELASGLTVVRGSRPSVKMFLRAEDVFGFTQRVSRELREFEQLESGYRASGPVRRGSGLARAIESVASQRRELSRRYGENPDGRSHGETFLSLLEERLVPRGLYFLDEPETPLSPGRVLALIALLNDAISEKSQFVIATHSPILMVLPEAQIWQFADGEIGTVAYDDVEHVRVTRDFLRAPERFLRHLRHARDSAGPRDDEP